MNIGKNAHFIFRQQVRKKKHSDMLLPRSFLAPHGGISYFLCGESFKTNIYIQNYFPLLTDSTDAGARWSVDIYNANGEHVEKQSGTLRGKGGVVITIADEKKYGAYGMVWVKIALHDEEYTAAKPFGTIFFTELSRKTEQKTLKILMHSLGFPMASRYDYDRTATGLMLPPESVPHLIYANGSELHGAVASCTATFVNRAHASLAVVLPSVPHSLGVQKIDLFKTEPKLSAHIGNDPFSIRLSGKNILGKPLLIMQGEGTFKGDHL